MTYVFYFVAAVKHLVKLILNSALKLKSTIMIIKSKSHCHKGFVVRIQCFSLRTNQLQ